MAVASQRWRTDTDGLQASVELAAFQLSETRQPAAPTASVGTGTGAFGIVVDGGGETIGETGPVPNGLEDAAIEELWLETTDQDPINTAEDTVEGGDLVMAAVACADAVGAWARPRHRRFGGPLRTARPRAWSRD